MGVCVAVAVGSGVCVGVAVGLRVVVAVAVTSGGRVVGPVAKGFGVAEDNPTVVAPA